MIPNGSTNYATTDTKCPAGGRASAWESLEGECIVVCECGHDERYDRKPNRAINAMNNHARGR